MKKFLLILVLGLVVFFYGCTRNSIITSNEPTQIPEVTSISSTSISNSKEIKIKPQEALALLVEAYTLSDSRPDKGYSYDGIEIESGYYLFSWSNSGKGTGASFRVDPYSGDVYSNGKKTANLLATIESTKLESVEASNNLQESDLPFIKITPINSFHNNDYYGKILNYKIDAVEIDVDKRYVVSFSIEYPCLYKTKNMSVLQEVNEQLKMVPFRAVHIDNYNQVLNDFCSIINKENEGVRSAKGTCKIYLFNDDYISLGYKCDYGYDGRTSSQNRLLTIDLRTGKCADLKDCINLDSIIDNIRNLKFDIMEGSYTDGFGTGKEPERIASFIEEFQYSNRCEVTTFSMDKSYLYLNFPYQDSLDGYMLLRFNLNDLKQ